ncbi:MAG TPA: cbb3-type cytochrome oxidase assembly protein CcoS [Prolixibacteraceae bacterium]|nr:cbb3-type cytochrome oxidase assembly protein CcoS [Prolixibacteraceae bacterium]
MSVIFVLIVIGILVASGFLTAFIWAVKTGQFDDSYTPSVRMLFDDTPDDEIEKKEIEENSGEKSTET